MYESKIKFILGYYGTEQQLIQTAEESAELAQAALKVNRAGTSEEKVVALQHLKEEIADVVVMLDQLMYAYGCEADVRAIALAKLDRQIERITKEGTPSESLQDGDSWLMTRFQRQD